MPYREDMHLAYRRWRHCSWRGIGLGVLLATSTLILGTPTTPAWAQNGQTQRSTYEKAYRLSLNCATATYIISILSDTTLPEYKKDQSKYLEAAKRASGAAHELAKRLGYSEERFTSDSNAKMTEATRSAYAHDNNYIRNAISECKTIGILE